MSNNDEVPSNFLCVIGKQSTALDKNIHTSIRLCHNSRIDTNEFKNNRNSKLSFLAI